MSKRVFKNPAKLQKHWTRKLLPDPSSDHVKSLCAAMAIGVKLPPIYIVETPDNSEGGLVVAGWSRREGHKARQVDIECTVITEAEAMNIALGENTNRQSYQYKYQVAWVYCPLAVKAVEAGKSQQIAGLKAGNGSREASSGLTGNSPTTLAEVADLIGVSRTKLVEVKECYDKIIAWDRANEPRRWSDEKEKRTAHDYWSSRILDPEDPCTPGNAIAGMAGKLAGDEGKTKPAPKQLELFCEGLASVAKWAKNFDKFSDDEHRKAVIAVKSTVAAMPPTLREEVLSEIKRLNRESREGK